MEISSKKLSARLGAVFILGFLFSILNSSYTETSDSSLPFMSLFNRYFLYSLEFYNSFVSMEDR